MSTYSIRGEPAEHVRETALNHVVFSQDFVYKIKRPVLWRGLVDYRSLDARERATVSECGLVEAVAPSVRPSVVPVVLCENGTDIGGYGRPSDCALKLVRLPDSTMLAEVIQRGELTSEVADSIARETRRLHERLASLRTPGYRANKAFSQLRLADVTTWVSDIGLATGETSGRILSALRIADELLAAAPIDERSRLGQRIHGDLHVDTTFWLQGHFVFLDPNSVVPRWGFGDPLVDVAAMFRGLAYYSGPAAAHRYLTTYLREAGLSFARIRGLFLFHVYFWVLLRYCLALVSQTDAAELIAWSQRALAAPETLVDLD